MSDPFTTIDWATQIVLIQKRFESSLRAGETLDSLESWLDQVPGEFREQLKSVLQDCTAMIGQESIETRVLMSDAALGSAQLGSGQLGSDQGSNEAFVFDRDRESKTAVDRCQTFCGLADRARRDLQQHLEEKTFSAGEQLLGQGQQARGLYLILNGSVDVIDVQTGERIDCDGAGSVLGEMSLLTGQPCSAEVTATSAVSALVLSEESYRQLTAAHPELEIALSQLVSDRLGGRRHDALCGKIIGDYRLNHCISRGGMGVVYEATNAVSGGLVALKMLRHRFIYDNEVKGRFDQEAELLRNLRHPHVVALRDHFLAYRTRFLVLDLCDGADLFRVIRTHGPFAEPEVRAVMGQIAKGLQYAHAAGVIHRDLKPGNVLVDRDGKIRLTDFGLSKLIESEVEDRKAVGTPSYMPPEQFQSSQVGPEIDYYALGCVACEMLTGQLLFPATSWREMLWFKKSQQPGPDWPAINVSCELRQVILAMLQPIASDRKCDLQALSCWAENLDGLFTSSE